MIQRFRLLKEVNKITIVKDVVVISLLDCIYNGIAVKNITFLISTRLDVEICH